MGKCPKLSPRFSGPFKVLNKIGRAVYRLEHPVRTKVHSVFHVSRLKERLGGKDDLIPTDDLVLLEDLIAFVPHEPDRIMDTRCHQFRNRLISEHLIRWKGKSDDEDTWEREDDLRLRFPGFFP
ncbi:hypothetical protein O6H91_21G002500 [Diphasiastrum complanatum]|uniref:Uncharacterized protein n=1 Tax=Diphasiastrum complanatum TaxID=34168 RepID=A0ACC2AHF1_DIPCM|nr:hypothetical protein O6H91_Y235500 [Diphasiastrum complanatum]KAJ7516875.1 hypothetical protein O6H91_21G002500 [Diphasiastrum complanatum]